MEKKYKKLQAFNITEVNRLIRNRRTIKPEYYTGEIIEQETIDNILENANWAPNHGLNEPWRFKVFSHNAKLKLGVFLADAYKEMTIANDRFNELKFNKIITRSEKASHIIAIAMHRKPKTKIIEMEDMEAVACAVQNMHLTATAYGLAAYWSTGGVTYQPSAHKYLQLADNERCLGFFYLGYPAKDWPEGKRKPIADKVTFLQ